MENNFPLVYLKMIQKLRASLNRREEIDFAKMGKEVQTGGYITFRLTLINYQGTKKFCITTMGSNIEALPSSLEGLRLVHNFGNHIKLTSSFWCLKTQEIFFITRHKAVLHKFFFGRDL